MKPKTDPQQEAEVIPSDEEQRETGNAEGRERAVQGRSHVSVLALERPWYPTELELQLHSSERNQDGEHCGAKRRSPFHPYLLL